MSGILWSYTIVATIAHLSYCWDLVCHWLLAVTSEAIDREKKTRTLVVHRKTLLIRDAAPDNKLIKTMKDGVSDGLLRWLIVLAIRRDRAFVLMLLVCSSFAVVSFSFLDLYSADVESVGQSIHSPTRTCSWAQCSSCWRGSIPCRLYFTVAAVIVTHLPLFREETVFVCYAYIKRFSDVTLCFVVTRAQQ